MPAKRVIILTIEGDNAAYALRADAAKGHESHFARRDYQSSYGDSLDPDLLAIQSGSVVEEIETNLFSHLPGETDEAFERRLRSMLQTRWAEWERTIRAKQPLRMYGASWDGERWS